ncbi:leucine-rich repeat-containing protein 2-like [Xenopus laevis]|uniref:Leucine-rich repeat-containing protein 2-like n=1 Tax=Xenopus laevis TaxID=8355 RepID=A0A8J1LYQ8_XENLA|nr:leucine-rich repeat-containing protein 2-like [Xenopus laevis]
MTVQLTVIRYQVINPQPSSTLILLLCELPENIQNSTEELEDEKEEEPGNIKPTILAVGVLTASTELPDIVKEQTYLKELYVNNTSIQTTPKYIQMFRKLIVLDVSHNKIRCLPSEIGYLENLKEFNIHFNNLQIIPPELGNCENLEKFDLSGNLELTELPFELSSLKKVTFVDVSANKFSSLPICVLRMSSLQRLDISSNKLQDLPQGIDRNTTLEYQYIKLIDSLCLEAKEEKESTKDREYFEKEFMKTYIEDLTYRG